VVREAGGGVSSPPYAETIKGSPNFDLIYERLVEKGLIKNRGNWGGINQARRTIDAQEYGSTLGNLGNLRATDAGFDSAISSPPFAESIASDDRVGNASTYTGHRSIEYAPTLGNLASLRATDAGFSAAVRTIDDRLKVSYNPSHDKIRSPQNGTSPTDGGDRKVVRKGETECASDSQASKHKSGHGVDASERERNRNPNELRRIEVRSRDGNDQGNAVLVRKEDAEGRGRAARKEGQWPESLSMERWQGETRISQSSSEREMRELRDETEPLYPSQGLESLQQQPGQSPGSMCVMPLEPSQDIILGSSEVGKETEQEQRANGMEQITPGQLAAMRADGFEATILLASQGNRDIILDREVISCQTAKIAERPSQDEADGVEHVMESTTARKSKANPSPLDLETKFEPLDSTSQHRNVGDQVIPIGMAGEKPGEDTPGVSSDERFLNETAASVPDVDRQSNSKYTTKKTRAGRAVSGITGSTISKRFAHPVISDIIDASGTMPLAPCVENNIEPKPPSRVAPQLAEENLLGERNNDITPGESDNFWLAARVIVEQTYAILRPGAHAVWVVKSFIRSGAIVDFPDQWWQLCEACGFVTLHEHHALLVRDDGTQLAMDGNHKSHRKKRVSFFRRLYEQKRPDLAIDWETVFCMVKR